MPVLFQLAWSQQTNPSTPTTMSSNKQYIGSGKPTQNNGIKVTLRMDDAMAHTYTTDKGTFLTFLVAPKRETDQYGKTHTAFVMPREARPETNVVAEPQGLPVGTVITEGGRKFRKISAAEAAKRRKEQVLG